MCLFELWICNYLRLLMGGRAGMVLGTNPLGRRREKIIPAAKKGMEMNIH